MLFGTINKKITAILRGIFPPVAERLFPRYQKRDRNKTDSPEPVDTPLSSELEQAISRMKGHCTACGDCVQQCAFLEKYGIPRDIVRRYDFRRKENQQIAYECSLCGMCSAVCPEKLNPALLFLTIRRESICRRNTNLNRYRKILAYERRGVSARYSYYSFPEGCDTVFFPGCTLSGTRPQTTWEIFKRLQPSFPNIGIVLDCCTKASHDLGRQAYFEAMFGELCAYLMKNGIKTILVACPSCQRMFRQFGNDFYVEMIYRHLGKQTQILGAILTGTVTVHDPCPLRGDSVTHDAVRNILKWMGLTVFEMKHCREQTLCCGEGGLVEAGSTTLAFRWGQLRKKESGGKKVVIYCAGCHRFLGRVVPVIHLADLMISPKRAMAGKAGVSKTPFTYINRLKLKRWIQREMPAVTTRERMYSPEKRIDGE